ncbi:hypothetical protein BD289DRAFT_421066 [Coniella lustricola]|uniref:Uncharacterized protein n=1 Tax=Coniella lustricola TaxID=2025994 RepID=A0A2T3ALZ0_9PEZI|nr:hypothetical protein BD289DRAFT_421066 [Coniella lustricola]
MFEREKGPGSWYFVPNLYNISSFSIPHFTGFWSHRSRHWRRSVHPSILRNEFDMSMLETDVDFLTRSRLYCVVICFIAGLFSSSIQYHDLRRGNVMMVEIPSLPNEG